MHSSFDNLTTTLEAPTVRTSARTLRGSRAASLISLGMLTSIVAVAGGRDAAAATCDQYPVPLRPTSSAQSAAQSDLSSLSPSATLSWNNDTGTLSGVSQLAVPLSGCTAGQDVGAQLRQLVSAHPQLFQIDPTEWRTAEFYDCQYLVDPTIISMGRQRLAGRTVATDVFAYTLARVNGTVQLTAVNGTYLPIVGTPTGDTMAACSTLTQSAATTTARNTALRLNVYSQCRRTGTMTYTPKASDSFRLAADDTWTWQTSPGEALLTGERVLRVTVNPSNYTSQLMNSDARCPKSDGNGFTIGFDITFDVHTGAIVNVKPGLDCVVC